MNFLLPPRPFHRMGVWSAYGSVHALAHLPALLRGPVGWVLLVCGLLGLGLIGRWVCLARLLLVCWEPLGSDMKRSNSGRGGGTKPGTFGLGRETFGLGLRTVGGRAGNLWSRSGNLWARTKNFRGRAGKFWTRIGNLWALTRHFGL